LKSSIDAIDISIHTLAPDARHAWMSLELQQSQENVDKSKSQFAINSSPKNDKAAEVDTLVPIPDEKEEEAVTKTKELQPEREATFKDYLVRSQYYYPSMCV
jgi:hypothetical protein